MSLFEDERIDEVKRILGRMLPDLDLERVGIVGAVHALNVELHALRKLLKAARTWRSIRACEHTSSPHDGCPNCDATRALLRAVDAVPRRTSKSVPLPEAVERSSVVQLRRLRSHVLSFAAVWRTDSRTESNEFAAMVEEAKRP